MKHAALWSLLLALAACGPKAGSANPVLPDVPFDELDHSQRIQFMKQVVMPTMAPLFKEHDPERFASFDCRTCHGPSAERGEYHMPNGLLPKLNLADLSTHKARDVEFMQTKVKPTMASLLKQPEYSEQNTDGFGCLGCHTKAP